MPPPGDHSPFTTNLGNLSELDEHELICASYQANSTYNTSPISKLPNDILSSVFLMNLEKAHAFRFHCEALESTISASQVCRHWRDVALDCAILWISIMDFESDSREWTQELLGRTKQVPFNVGSSRGACPRPRNLNLILDLCFRWKIFHVQIENITEELLCAIQQPAPSLEMFGIILCPGGQDVTILPTMLFNGIAPRLREIRLQRCCLDTTTSMFTQLTSLKVLWDGGFAGPTVLEWLNLLNNIPQLEKLYISRAISISTITGPLPRVELPHLWDLGIGATLAECSCFLSHIDIPPLTRFLLTTYELRPHPDFQVVLKFLEERVEEWTRDTVDDKCHAFFQPRSFRISIGTPFPQDPFESSIQVIFDWEGFTGNELRDTTILFAHPFIKIFSPLLHNARSLHTYYQDDVSTVDSVTTMTLLAVSFLHPFDNLIILHLMGDVHISMFPLFELVHVVCEDSRGSKSGLMLPSLQVLEFTACDFKYNEHGLNTLRAFLKFRSDNGIKIKKINFTDCILDEGEENAMKELGIDISSIRRHDIQFE